MLNRERAGTAYNKAENRRRLMATIHRSAGSIERKLQNISAVMDVLGAQWIQEGVQVFGRKRASSVTRQGRHVHIRPHSGLQCLQL